MGKEQILYDDDKAATYKTNIEGWVNSHGHFWGKDEHMARWSGCTDLKCKQCGTIHNKSWTLCEKCRDKKQHDKYYEYDLVEWDGESPVCIHDTDIYFFGGIEEVEDYCVYHDVKIEELQLLHCEANTLPDFDIMDLLEDYLCEEHTVDDLPVGAVDAVEDLNESLKNSKPLTWIPVSKAVKIDSGL